MNWLIRLIRILAVTSQLRGLSHIYMILLTPVRHSQRLVFTWPWPDLRSQISFLIKLGGDSRVKKEEQNYVHTRRATTM